MARTAKEATEEVVKKETTKKKTEGKTKTEATTKKVATKKTETTKKAETTKKIKKIDEKLGKIKNAKSTKPDVIKETTTTTE